MKIKRRNEPGHFAAQIDISLQTLADRVNLRKEYYDLREYTRAKVERIDLAENRRLNTIFVHIPKCGGTSVENQLKIYHGHRSTVYFKTCDEDLFGKAFKFTIVRNPYDKLVSGFHYLKHHTKSQLDKKWASANLEPFADFGAFAAALENKSFASKVIGWKHFVPQWYFVCDRRFGLMVDYYGKIEDFDDVVAQVGRLSTLRIRNEVHRSSVRKPWQDYYSDRTRRIVAHLYREDFSVFGYPP